MSASVRDQPVCHSFPPLPGCSNYRMPVLWCLWTMGSVWSYQVGAHWSSVCLLCTFRWWQWFHLWILDSVTFLFMCCLLFFDSSDVLVWTLQLTVTFFSLSCSQCLQLSALCLCRVLGDGVIYQAFMFFKLNFAGIHANLDLDVCFVCLSTDQTHIFRIWSTTFVHMYAPYCCTICAACVCTACTPYCGVARTVRLRTAYASCCCTQYTLCCRKTRDACRCVLIVRHHHHRCWPWPPGSIVIVCVITLSTIPVFGLSVFHMVLVSKGRTTNEQVGHAVAAVWTALWPVPRFYVGCLWGL